jgi:hypothetical protein
MEESHDLRIQANRFGELANGFLSSRIPCARVKPLLLVVDGGRRRGRVRAVFCFNSDMPKDLGRQITKPVTFQSALPLALLTT